MKTLLSFCFSGILIAAQVGAQSTFSFAPTVVSVQAVPGDYAQGNASFINLTNETLSFTWVREVLMIEPVEAATAVVGPWLSYPPFQSTANFTLGPADSSSLSLGYLNFTNEQGCALVRIRVFNQTNPADSASVLYRFNECASATTAQDEQPAIRLYPNPFSATFRLEGAEEVAQVRFIQADGREALRLTASPGQDYTPAELPAGNYIVVLEDNAGRVVQLCPVQKR